ncbi:alpha/beta hydrolase [Methylocapsa acidiphila]|uniref:alpha/beta hydrolase n=1 Tax=Methylocapsa acidiphila TaxID=133552 RepID=UPI0003F8FC27|nr:PHB depolymerase family esterase [Methylocapsa acidiphila]
MEIKEGTCLAAMSCGKPAYLVVLLDEPGAAEAKLVDIAINWQPTMLKADFLLAEAPLPGKKPNSWKWFETEGKSPDEIRAGIEEAAAALNIFLDEMLAKRRLDDNHLALVGFSQGADMALHVGLRRPKTMGGVVAFSGTYSAGAAAGAEIAAKPQILLVHGDADPVAPLAAMTKTKEALKALDAPVKSMSRIGIGHVIDDDGVMGCETFLAKTLIKPKVKKEDHHDEHDDHDLEEAYRVVPGSSIFSNGT